MPNSIVYHDFGPDRREIPTTIIKDVQRDEVEFFKYFETVYKSRWLIFAIIILGLICATFYIIAAKPTYESNFLIHVEEQGDKRSNTTLNELGTMFNLKASATAEIELVKSRLVISRALDKLDVYVSSHPVYFPLVGKWIATKGWSLPIPSGFGGYAWHGETVKVSSFTVPEKLLNKKFVVISGVDGKFLLQTEDRSIAAEGKVGIPLDINSSFGPIQLLLSDLQAVPGVRFSIQRSSKFSLIQQTLNNLSAVEQGKQSSVISVTLRGEDPRFISDVLSEIARQYVEQNAARKMQEAQNALTFLNKQLPELKKQLEESETRYNEYRNAKGTIDLPEEAKSSLQQLALAKTRKIELEQKRTELLVRFTPNHPVLMAIDTQLRDTNNEIKKLNGNIKSLPLIEQEVLKLSRDVKINTELYTSLLNSARQLKLVTASATTNVRLVDMPMVPEKASSWGASKILAIGGTAGLLFGVIIGFARKALGGKLETPTEIEQDLNIPVFATIPFSKMQKRLQREKREPAKSIPLLSKEAPLDKAIESLRNFRTLLKLSAPHVRNNITLITSPKAGDGKSFICANLATITGAGYKRVLVIDADLRRGDLHKYYQTDRCPGLAEAIAGDASMESVIHHAVTMNVDFIACGALPPGLELLLHPRFESLLLSLSAKYDMVLINGAPLLEVSDSLAISAHAGATYLVARAEVSRPGEIEESLNILRRAGCAIKGCLLNGVMSGEKSSYVRHSYSAYLPMTHSLRGRLTNGTVADVPDLRHA